MSVDYQIIPAKNGKPFFDSGGIAKHLGGMQDE
jgi:hypothetical protein